MSLDEAARIIGDPDVDATSPRTNRSRAPILLGLCLLGAVACAVRSGNAYYHLDDLTHYLYARWAWRWPVYLLDDWGRPGFTIAYFLPSGLGWMACRIFSACLTAATAWFAFLSANRLGLRRAWLAIPFCFAQPLLFLLSQTTLTETPLAFYVSLATWLALTRRWGWSSLVLSAAFITRHEAVLFLPIWVYFGRRDGAKWRSLLLLPLMPLIANVATTAIGMQSLVERFLNPTPTAQYGRGGWLTYVARSLHAFGPAIAVLAVVGIASLRRYRTAQLVVASAVAYFVGQTIVYRFGLFASGGYARFLVGIAPLVAILAVEGLASLLDHTASVRRKSIVIAGGAMILLWAAMERQFHLQSGVDIHLPYMQIAKWAVRSSTMVMTIACIVAYFATGESRRSPARWSVPAVLALQLALTMAAFHRPLAKSDDARRIDEAMAAIRSRALWDRPIITAHPYVEYLVSDVRAPDQPPFRERIAAAPIGTLVVWESWLAGSGDDALAWTELASGGSFRRVYESSPLPPHDTAFLQIFEKVVP